MEVTVRIKDLDQNAIHRVTGYGQTIAEANRNALYSLRVLLKTDNLEILENPKPKPKVNDQRF